jgi:paraquat-inducible protein B
MDIANAPPAPPQAISRRSHRLSAIWLIPLLAVAIAAWLVWDTLSKEGPTIEVSFDSAEGLQAGKSPLKFKDIEFGTVKSLRLSPDNAHVLVTIATNAQAPPLLTEGAVFWVVKPRFFAGNISGLDTILSGSYVGILPAASRGKKQTTFKGQENPPLVEANVPGHTFLLKSKRIGSISVGSPIFFRDLAVGEVLGWDIADMAESVMIHAFVRAPYDSYVVEQTRFWNASGISLGLGPQGLDIKMESLRALLLGGIAFATPPVARQASAGSDQARAAPEKHVFPLFADQATADAASYTRTIMAVSYFPGSLRGVAKGSEVTMHGLKIGEVTEVRLVYDEAKKAIVAPVYFEVQPERIVGVGNRVYYSDEKAVEALLERGLRASLQSTSLITGEQSVALAFAADAPSASLRREGDDFVIPITEGEGFAELSSSATELVDKVRTIPFAIIGQNLSGILKSVNDATKGPELKNAVTSLQTTLASAQDMVKQLDKNVGPASKRLPEISADLQKTLGNANKLIVSLDNGYGNDTKLNRDMNRLMVEFTGAARAIRALADMLQRNPEALIKGRASGAQE